MKIRGTQKRSPIAAGTLILALVVSTIATQQNAFASSQNPPSATARIKRLEEQRDQAGRDLERALIELEHSQNLNLAKDEKIKVLEEKAQAAIDLANLYKETTEQLRIADAARAKANAIDDERVKLYEARIKLYEESMAAFQAEVARLRKQRGFTAKLGAGLLVVGLLIGAALGVAVAK